MKLSELTRPQLARIYRRLYDSLPYGGHFGWDYPTLRLTYPGKYAALRAVAIEHDKKLHEESHIAQVGKVIHT